MGFFSRSPRSSSGKDADEKRVGLDPLPTVPREDGRGESLSSTTKYFDIGLADDWNYPSRRSMEDTNVAIVDYMGIPGCAYLAVFDGHAGPQCAQIAAQHLHVILATEIQQQIKKDIALALSTAFQALDAQLPSMEIRNSGSTAVVAVTCFMSEAGEIVSAHTEGSLRRVYVANVGDSRAVLGQEAPQEPAQEPPGETPGDDAPQPSSDAEDSSSFKTERDADQYGAIVTHRLSHDHRCSDVNEQQRVKNAGGLVVNNRVNGMLAVTRSLGDLFMKNYVVGAPYTTETVVSAGDFLVLACDGLFDVLNDERATQIAASAFKHGKNAEAASKDLLGQALQAFSIDNITVMVIRLQ